MNTSKIKPLHLSVPRTRGTTRVASTKPADSSATVSRAPQHPAPPKPGGLQRFRM
jgi:hypothetical protein